MEFITGHMLCITASKTEEYPRWNLKTGPLYTEGKEREEKGRSLQNGRWRFNKQGNLHTRLVLGSHKIGDLIHLPESLKVYMEALTASVTMQFKWS